MDAGGQSNLADANATEPDSSVSLLPVSIYFSPALAEGSTSVPAAAERLAPSAIRYDPGLALTGEQRWRTIGRSHVVIPKPSFPSRCKAQNRLSADSDSGSLRMPSIKNHGAIRP
jgi:hypothetical protein